MTKNQKQLYSLMMEENRAARIAGAPYLRNGSKIIAALAETVSDDTAIAMISDLRSGSFDESFRQTVDEDMEAGGDGDSTHTTCRMEYLLWSIYLLDYSGTPWQTMQEALLDIFQQTGVFYRAAQNKITNALPGLFDSGLQMNVLGEATGAVGTRKTNEVQFVLRNAGTHELRTTAKMLMDVLLIEFARTHSPDVELTIRQYAEMRGKSTSKDSLDELKKQVVEDLDTLADIKAQYYEKRKHSGYIELNGGTHMVKHGRIYWNWNQHLLPSLERMAAIDYSRETLTADPRTSAYYFSRYIDVNFRRNEGKQSVNKIFIKKLLETTPYIPDIDTLRAQRGNVRERVIGRFFRDLDSLERLYYDVYTADGALVSDPLSMDIDDFKNGYILIDYSDYEEHPERIQRREKRKKREAVGRKTGNKKKKSEEKTD